MDDATIWRLNDLKSILPTTYFNKFLAYPSPTNNTDPDVPFWIGEKSKDLSISSAYHLSRKDTTIIAGAPWREIWKLDAIERIRSFAWKIMLGRLLTKTYGAKWTNGVSCHRCNGVLETIDHCSSGVSASFSTLESCCLRLAEAEILWMLIHRLGYVQHQD